MYVFFFTSMMTKKEDSKIQPNCWMHWNDRQSISNSIQSRRHSIVSHRAPFDSKPNGIDGLKLRFSKFFSLFFIRKEEKITYSITNKNTVLRTQ